MPTPSTPLTLDGLSLDIEAFVSVVAWGRRVELGDEARARMRASRAVIERAAASGEAIYGVNTGFGNLANVRVPDDELATLQERLVLSHAAGVGEPLDEPTVRGMLLLRANTLARGLSGVRE
ncbi:MAG: aromatic amino acid lyase, partial [Myxococcota bacterium]